jgi:hypothetical protein
VVEKIKLSRTPVEVVKPVYGNPTMTDALREIAVKSTMAYEGKATELWVREINRAIDDET